MSTDIDMIMRCLDPLKQDSFDQFDMVGSYRSSPSTVCKASARVVIKGR